jgi:hypothetical protein
MRRALLNMALFGGGAIGAVVFHALAPAWAEILVGTCVLTAWALWVTQPAGSSLRGHAAFKLGEVVLRVVTGALTVVLAVVVLVAILAASWSFVGPKVDAWWDRKTTAAKEAITPDIPKVDVGGIIDTIKGKVSNP